MYYCSEQQRKSSADTTIQLLTLLVVRLRPNPQAGAPMLDALAAVFARRPLPVAWGT